jgi:Ni2+-binding GTPase involved in maturation of urease and hydrogenase
MIHFGRLNACFLSRMNYHDLVIVENIGTLACPAEFQLEGDERMMVLSTTEGEGALYEIFS